MNNKTAHPARFYRNFPDCAKKRMIDQFGPISLEPDHAPHLNSSGERYNSARYTFTPPSIVSSNKDPSIAPSVQSLAAIPTSWDQLILHASSTLIPAHLFLLCSRSNSPQQRRWQREAFPSSNPLVHPAMDIDPASKIAGRQNHGSALCHVAPLHY